MQYCKARDFRDVDSYLTPMVLRTVGTAWKAAGLKCFNPNDFLHLEIRNNIPGYFEKLKCYPKYTKNTQFNIRGKTKSLSQLMVEDMVKFKERESKLLMDSLKTITLEMISTLEFDNILTNIIILRLQEFENNKCAEDVVGTGRYLHSKFSRQELILLLCIRMNLNWNYDLSWLFNLYMTWRIYLYKKDYFKDQPTHSFLEVDRVWNLFLDKGESKDPLGAGLYTWALNFGIANDIPQQGIENFTVECLNVLELPSKPDYSTPFILPDSETTVSVDEPSVCTQDSQQTHSCRVQVEQKILENIDIHLISKDLLMTMELQQFLLAHYEVKSTTLIKDEYKKTYHQKPTVWKIETEFKMTILNCPISILDDIKQHLKGQQEADTLEFIQITI